MMMIQFCFQNISLWLTCNAIHNNECNFEWNYELPDIEGERKCDCGFSLGLTLAKHY